MAYFDNGNKIFADARANHYAVGAYNINNLEWTRAILRAANETQTPVLVQVSMGAAKYMGGFKFVRDMVADQMDAMNITVPVILNLDHGDFAAAMECINLGYSSVMYDGHKLPLEENYEQTQEVIHAAHQRGISVEAEIGKVGENQDTSSGELASVEDARAFAELGVDKLACGIGNIHGIYPQDWKGLDFTRLAAISDAVEIPLVLHGGSGIPKEQVQKAISMGIAKVNINTEFQLAFQAATRAYVEASHDLDKDHKGYDPRKLLLPGTEAITEKMKEMIAWLGTPAVA